MMSATEMLTVENFFARAHACCRQAQESCNNTIDRYYQIGHEIIQLRFSGGALLPLISPAIEHLAVTERKADLTIYLCDSKSSGLSMPPPIASAETFPANGEVKELIDDRYYAHFEIGPNALSLIDFEKRLAIYWVNYPALIPDYEIAVPLRTIFHIWASRKQMHIVHAGAVGNPDGGVLLIGRGGAGKSNSALACLDSPLGYLSDDHCLLTSEPEPTVHSIYATGKTHPQDIDRLPHLAGMIANSDRLSTEKALYLIHRHYPEKLIKSFPLRAVLMPRVTGKIETTLQPASPALGLMMLGPAQALQWPSAAKITFQTIAKIFRLVPCYHLNLGTDRKQIPQVIMALLNGEEVKS